jgi:DNA (cytosine-5)-methyltransferase 1
MLKNYTYIDLFAGCGGLSLGLHNAGWKGLFAIEKNPDAFKTLKHNLIDTKSHFNWPEWLGEPTNLEIDKVLKEYKDELLSLQGKVDMVAGGPPCQGFSSAGRRRENDQRNHLVKSYIKFIKLVRPKIIFFENVKGFTLEFKKNKEKGRKYSNYVEGALTRAGYRVKGQLINFGDYGVPQKRTRFILVGVREDLAKLDDKIAESFFTKIDADKEAFLINKNISVNTKLKDAISDLLRSHGTIISPDSKDFQAGIYSESTNPYQLLMRGRNKTGVVDSHRFANHRDDIVSKFSYIIANARKNKNVDKSIRKKYEIKKHTVIALDKNSKSPTITSLPDDYIHYKEPRILWRFRDR